MRSHEARERVGPLGNGLCCLTGFASANMDTVTPLLLSTAAA